MECRSVCISTPLTVHQVKLLNTVRSMKEGSLSLIDCSPPIIRHNQPGMIGAKFHRRDKLKCAEEGELRE